MIGPVGSPGLHVMTFNIRRRMSRMPMRPADAWRSRSPHLAALLRAESPTLLGVQEALPDQTDFVRRAMGHRYRSIGRGRNSNGGGEECPLVYDADRLQLVNWEQFALSDRPDAPGSTSWGNVIPRIVVTATFLDRATSHRFVAMNTHFDHLSRRSRVRSAHALRVRAAEQEWPVVLTGDLNSGEATAPLNELFSDGALVDAWASARSQLTEEWGTFPNYRLPRLDRKRIDWIAVSADIEVERAAINPGRYDGGWASDHLPVQAVLRVERRER